MMTSKVDETGTSESEARLPLCYRSLGALNSMAHADMVFDKTSNFSFARNTEVIPLTLAEVSVAQRDYPILFSAGDAPVPIAVTGLPGEGNGFIDDAGMWRSGAYVPSYIRRYPFLLARLDQGSDALSLCFDGKADCFSTSLGKGNLFERGEPSQVTRDILAFCEQYEFAARQTEAAVAELVQFELLEPGHAQMRRSSGDPLNLDGFSIVSEKKLKELAGFEVGKLLKSGALLLIYAHLFSIRRLDDLVAEAVGGEPSGDEAALRETERAPCSNKH